MAGERTDGGEGLRVERVHERSRVEEAVLASVYELLVPIQRWGLHRNRQERSTGSGALMGLISGPRRANGNRGYG